MIKEDYYKSMGVFTKTHDFAEKRKSERLGDYYHSGIDWWSKAGKSQYIYNLMAGVIVHCELSEIYGNQVLIMHDPLYAGGPQSKLYSLYCHLSEVDKYVSSRKGFVNAGNVIGKMGNTGNCWTKGLTGYRPVTEKEKRDKKSMKGVHLHQEFFVIAESGEKTVLLNDMINRQVVIEGDSNHYFYQWGKLVINPDKIMKYFMLLQGRKV